MKQDVLWSYQGKELWKDMDQKRQLIVHKDEMVEISVDYLFEIFFYVHRLMLGIALNAQVYQGVKFSFNKMEESVKCKIPPSLR